MSKLHLFLLNICQAFNSLKSVVYQNEYTHGTIFEYVYAKGLVLKIRNAIFA